MFKKQVSILFCILCVKGTYRLSQKFLWGFDKMNMGILNACESIHVYFASFFLWVILISSHASCSFLNDISFIVTLNFCIELGTLGHNSKGSNIPTRVLVLSVIPRWKTHNPRFFLQHAIVSLAGTNNLNFISIVICLVFHFTCKCQVISSFCLF